MKDIFKFSRQPQFDHPTLIVGWQEDAGRISPTVIEYINKKVKAKTFCEVEPTGFFSLAGVVVENDFAHFPESKFYFGDRSDLVIFKSNEPRFERFSFLSAISDFAQHYCHIKELYTINGTISSMAHTDPRRVMAVFNQPEFRRKWQGYGLKDMDWKGPPAINSYLLWIAQRKGIPGVSLWTEVPFYLATGEDFQAIKLTLSSLDKKLKLGLDLQELDEKIKQQNTRIDRLRKADADINRYIKMLENNLTLSREQQIQLTSKVTEVL